MLDLKPTEFYGLDMNDFFDMVEGKQLHNIHTQDSNLEWLSWFVANLMLSQGNMKKGAKADKIAKGLYVSVEERAKQEAEEQKKRIKKVDEKAVQVQRDDLLRRFNLSK